MSDGAPSFLAHVAWRLGLSRDPWPRTREWLAAVERECERSAVGLEAREALATHEITATGFREIPAEERLERLRAFRARRLP